MKKYTLVIFLILVSNQISAATNFVIVLAKDYPATLDRSRLFDQISSVVYDTLKQGDSLFVLSDSQNTLAEFKVQDQDGYDSRGLKRRIFHKPLENLKETIQLLPRGVETESGLLHTPQVLKFLSTQKFDVPVDRNVSVLLVGSPLYQDDKEPSFNMKDGVFPSDGHIRTSERHSIYGTDEKRGFLDGFSVHWLTANPESDYANDLYKLRIKRFWALFTKNQGGVLATFTNDVSTAFNRFSKAINIQTEANDFDYTANKVEMLRITRDALPVNETKEQARIADFMSDNVVLSNIPPTKNIGKLKIGIRWPCKECDIDLYAKTSTAGEYLYFGKASTDEGTYFKDFQNSPDTINGLEYIEFTKEVDVSNIDAKVNFYKGTTDKPVSGSVRAEFDGKVYEKPFTINSTQGNSGGNEPSNNWININVKDLLGLK